MSSRVLVVDDEPGLREMLRVMLTRAGYDVEVSGGQVSADAAIAAGDDSFAVVVTDLSMPDGSGMGVLRNARERDDTTQVVMITAYATTSQAVEAMRAGAYDYLKKPFKNDELLAVVEKALEKRSIVTQNRELRARLQQEFTTGNVVGKSPAMQHVMSMVQRVAGGPSSVLITGESGTGKEVIARALHDAGDRAKQPFVAVNCGALPEQLLESELFGHVRGAFTGATVDKEGLFLAARAGTLFLDEIGEMPSPLQVKLLRALQERKVRPVGASKELPVEARVVAATNRDIHDEVESGRFREDLFYRLNVINLQLPPLRERKEDIPLLAAHFLSKHGAVQNKHLDFSPEAMRWLVDREFKGNVRELENVVERAVALALGHWVELSDVVDQRAVSNGPLSIPEVDIPIEGLDVDGYLATIEKRILLRALDMSGGVRKDAAKLLGMSFRSFRYRLAKYGLASDDDTDAPRR